MDKELLLKDLCGRLPYGVKIKTINDDDIYTLLSLHPNKGVAVVGMEFDDVFITSKIKIEDIKPYLYPLSSITEEQKRELWEMGWSFDGVSIDNESGSDMIEFELVSSDSASYLIDWLNAHHFDYRGLIRDGLAIDATNLNIY